MMMMVVVVVVMLEGGVTPALSLSDPGGLPSSCSPFQPEG